MASYTRRENRLLSSADLDDCRKAVAIIKQERVVALATVDANRDWPLTILFVGTLDGNVYVFDVLENGKEQNKNFFKDIGLDDVLTSADITKVLCKGWFTSAALFFQFGIKLNGVFDIQIAENVIREHKGGRILSNVSISKLHSEYTRKSELPETDYWIQKKMGNYLAKRPLPDGILNNVCKRVHLQIKIVYQEQLRYLKENSLLEKFQESVQVALESEIYEEQSKRLHTKLSSIKKEVMGVIVAGCKKGQSRTVLYGDKDNKYIFNKVNIETILREGYPEIVLQLKSKCLKKFLDNKEKLMRSLDDFYPNKGILRILNDTTFYGKSEMKKQATTLKKRFLDIFAHDLQVKYGKDVSVTDLNRSDTYVIRALRPYDDRWPYPNVIMDLYWGVVENDIDKNRENMYVRWMWVGTIDTLMFYLDHPNVPLSVRRKIKYIVDAVIERLPQKYGMQSTADDVDDVEKAVLGTLDVTSNAYGSVVERLYWEVAYAMLCDKSKVMKVKQRFPNRIKFLATDDDEVPAAVQRKAQEILRNMKRY